MYSLATKKARVQSYVLGLVSYIFPYIIIIFHDPRKHPKGSSWKEKDPQWWLQFQWKILNASRQFSAMLTSVVTLIEKKKEKIIKLWLDTLFKTYEWYKEIINKLIKMLLTTDTLGKSLIRTTKSKLQ